MTEENLSLTATPGATPADLLRLAITKNVDVPSLEKLLDMQFRWEAQQAKREMDLATIGFKTEPDLKIIKSETVSYQTSSGTTEYRFPPLDRCCEVIVPLLAKHLISHRWRVDRKFEEGMALIYVTCILTHASGHSEEVTIPAPPDNTGGKNAVQAMASTITYLERYTLLAVTGLAAMDQPQGERNEDEVKLNPFTDLEGDAYKTAFADLWEAAKRSEPAERKAQLKQLLAWKYQHDEELFL